MDSSTALAVVVVLVLVATIVEFGIELKQYLNKEGRFSKSDTE